MSLGDRLGLGGLIVALFGIAVVYLWPDKKWIGWGSLSLATGLVAWWTWLELGPRLAAICRSYPIRSTAVVFLVGGSLASYGWWHLVRRAAAITITHSSETTGTIVPSSPRATKPGATPHVEHYPSAQEIADSVAAKIARMQKAQASDEDQLLTEALSLSRDIFSFLALRESHLPQLPGDFAKDFHMSQYMDEDVIPMGPSRFPPFVKAYNDETIRIYRADYDPKVARAVHKLLEKGYPIEVLSIPPKTIERIRTTAEVLSLVDHPPELKPMAEAIELSDLVANLWVDFDSRWNSIRADYDREHTPGAFDIYHQKLAALSAEEAREYQKEYKDRVIAVRREMLKQLPGTVDLSGSLLDTGTEPSWVGTMPTTVDSYRFIANDLNRLAEQYYSRLFGN